MIQSPSGQCRRPFFSTMYMATAALACCSTVYRVCVTVVPVRGSWCTNTLSTISRGARCGETPVLPSILSDRVTAGSRDFVVIERIVKHDEY